MVNRSRSCGARRKALSILEGPLEIVSLEMTTKSLGTGPSFQVNLGHLVLPPVLLFQNRTSGDCMVEQGNGVSIGRMSFLPPNHQCQSTDPNQCHGMMRRPSRLRFAFCWTLCAVINYTRALQPVATCRQSPYLRPVPSATKPAILIMTSLAPGPALQTYAHLTAFNI